MFSIASSRAWITGLKPRERRFLVAAALALLASIALVVMTARAVVAVQLRDNAEEEVENWTRFVASAIPELADELAAGQFSPRVVRRLALLAESDEVTGFRLYDLSGRLLLVSSELPRDLREGRSMRVAPRGEPVALAAAVAATGKEQVTLHYDGDVGDSGDHRGTHSDAMSRLSIDDQPVAVFEVTIDQTERAESAERAFLAIAGLVALLLSAIVAAGLMQIARGVADRRRVEARMIYLARHDVLSGALNRASFQEQLERAAWRHEQGGPGFAVLCIDLDHFKHVNDSLGHGGGDEVVRQATERLRALLRHGDVVARLGGDEFAILQSGVSRPDDVATLAQRVVEELALPFVVSGQRVSCGASIGAARFGADATTVQDLLRKADVALYRAKADGRGRFSFYDRALDEALAARRDLAHDLRHAVADGALHLHYQPLFAADGQRMVGYEALMRWQHPKRGAVPPVEFIPLAEATGQIQQLGQWALERACADAATWSDELSVAVNLSAAQFREDADLVSVVARALDAAGLPASRLELEITESLLMSNTTQVVETLHRLLKMGVRVAMDDFGTGYSSLAYLWRFPFNKIKIDRAFTSELGDDGRVGLIVRSIVSLSHALGIRVNAEGVETVSQLQALQALGCDELQGFLLGRPGPVGALGRGARAPAQVGDGDGDAATAPGLPRPA